MNHPRADELFVNVFLRHAQAAGSNTPFCVSGRPVLRSGRAEEDDASTSDVLVLRGKRGGYLGISAVSEDTVIPVESIEFVRLEVVPLGRAPGDV